jgi:DNA topoisomerase-1
MNLLIVESPGKVKKIQGFLGNGWKVAASVGHVRDLPEKENGVNPPDYVPRYEITKPDVIKSLTGLVKEAKAVYLATDLDREGEAIAWHLQEALKLKEPFRVTYTEITEAAVQNGVAQAHKIDMNLVHAQEARRVLDRLVGYPASRAVQDAAGQKGLRAGRVQSPALRLVVERETVIRNFKSTTHFGVELVFEAVQHVSDGWKAVWNTKNWLDEGQEYFLDKAVAERIAALRSLTVASYEEKEVKQTPPAPFTTSTLQQAASNALKFSPQQTMDLAQKLYEGGHITYMRTDSPNLSEEAIAEIRSLASKKDWPVPPKPRTFKSKAGAQEAHEAIRPTHFEEPEAGDNVNANALYRLIWVRAVASQLEDALFMATKAVLETELDGKKVIFEAKGRRMLEPGWRVVMEGDQTEDPDAEEEAANPIPELREGAMATALSGEVKTKKTNPPARFTQASLIRELEKRGIGRPSTYASIMNKITGQKYWTENKKRQLEPSPTGEQIISFLVGHFGFVEYEFTKNLELRLDDIAEGKTDYHTVVSETDDIHQQELSNFYRRPQGKGFACPACGSLLVHLSGKNKETSKPYDYWRCKNEACKKSFPNDNGKPDINKASATLSEHPCPECGRPLSHLVKEGPGGYDFWACSGYKDAENPCSAKYKDEGGKPGAKKEAVPLSEHPCPKCGRPLRHLVSDRNDRGGGYNFWSCSGYQDVNKPCKATYKDDGGKPGDMNVPKGFKGKAKDPKRK